ncbi:DNA-binding response regulator [Winogradskya humida]|uniref:DNA-binding response regulator n=2 Tax=Winogradskya humida TaxID=113566 RepID=A0ABQ4A7P9_9ACTN|nr:DNA-binding response regulator [Actinoplanes humidus]
MTAPGVRVMLVDDQPLLRRSLAMIINDAPGLEVVAETDNGLDAVTIARTIRPDVILMDIRMPHRDGLAATREICAEPLLAPTRVLVLSMFELDDYVYQALLAGASGFLLKDTRPQDLIDAIHRTHQGESLFAPSILTRLIAHYVTAPRLPQPVSVRGLTSRETEVLTLIGRGHSNQEIADQLNIAVKTVKAHITHLLSKTYARDRAQLVIAAYNAALVHPTP